MKTSAAIGLLLALFFAGCGTPGLKEAPQEARRGRRWSLVRMELDERNLANAGRLPLFPRPTGTSFGLEPRAFGFFYASLDGKVSCVVRAREPIVALDGSSGYNDYDLVNFYGRIDESGRFAFRPDTVDSDTKPLGVATSLVISEEGKDTIRVQARTGDRLLPYVMHFLRAATPDRPVQMPFVP